MIGSRIVPALALALVAIIGLAIPGQATEYPNLVNPNTAAAEETPAAAPQDGSAELETWLASDEVARIDFQALSREQAQDLISQTVEAYLAATVEPLAGLEPSARTDLAVQVVQGYESCKIRHSVQTFAMDKTLSKDRALVISSSEDAGELGALISEVANIALRLAGTTDDAAAEQVARKVFSEIVVDTENGIPALRQYLFATRDLAGLPDDRLKRMLKIGR